MPRTIEQVKTVAHNSGLSPLATQAVMTIRERISSHEHLVQLCREARQMHDGQLSVLLRVEAYDSCNIPVQKYQKGRDAFTSGKPN